MPPSSWRLLAALATAPAEGLRRADLAKLLIPTGKLSTLRKLLFETRRALSGTGLALLDGDADLLRLPEHVDCDVRDLRAERSIRPPHENYRGLLLDTRSSHSHEPWTEWLAVWRRDLLALYVQKAEMALSAPGGNSEQRMSEARHLLKHRPDHAGASRYLMLAAGRVSDAAQIEQRYGALQAGCRAAGGQVDRRATDVFYRLVGASQRGLGKPDVSEAICLPTIYVATPTEKGPSRAARMLRSLLVDVTIGLCRASMFRVIASDRTDGPPAVGADDRSPRAYRVATAIIDHVFGPQVVFTLLSDPEREVLWTEKVEAVPDLTVSAYNLLTAGVLRSLVDCIRDVELEAFQLEADPGAYALYLAGYSSLGSLDLARLRRGRHHLRRALSRSPDFAPTPSALARSLQLEWLVTGRGDYDLLAEARGHALQAIKADPLEARGYKALAFSDLYEKDYDTALENYARAEQLNRSYAELVAEHANCLLHCGMAKDALNKINYAIQLNPEYGDMYRWTKASACFFLSRYDEALDIIQQMDDRTPALRLLAAIHALKGDQREASLCRMYALDAYPSMTIEGWTNTMAMRDPHHIQHYTEGLVKAGFR